MQCHVTSRSSHGAPGTSNEIAWLVNQLAALFNNDSLSPAIVYLATSASKLSMSQLLSMNRMDFVARPGSVIFFTITTRASRFGSRDLNSHGTVPSKIQSPIASWFFSDLPILVVDTSPSRQAMMMGL